MNILINTFNIIGLYIMVASIIYIIYSIILFLINPDKIKLLYFWLTLSYIITYLLYIFFI